MKPHVVIVDAALGNGDSFRCVETVRKTVPEAKVIVMDLWPAQEDVDIRPAVLLPSPCR